MRLLILALICLGFSSCKKEVENQLIIPDRLKESGNPIPVKRNFAENNRKHKVIIAVIDDGIDYNHPLLLNNVHFQLNQDGVPVGFGYDYVAEDEWASPYIVRTVHLDPDIKANSDEKKRAAVLAARLESLRKEIPKFAKSISEGRHLSAEANENLWHGTHVAGLAIYDREDLGVVGYRVLPYNKVYKDGERKSYDKNEWIFERIVKAVRHAVNVMGATVVNISLGMEGDKDSHYAESFLRLAGKIKKLAQEFSDVVFLGSAGNGKKPIRKKRLHIPCGIIDEPNVLCVGSLDKDGDISDHTNVILTNQPTVYAIGTDILSAVPSRMCKMMPVLGFTTRGATPEKPWPDEDGKDYAIRNLHDCIDEMKKATREASGTSMASPLVARQVGILRAENLEIKSGEKIVELLFAKAHTDSNRNFIFRRIRVEKPSWYPAQMPKSDFDPWAYETSEKRYFDFVVAP